MASRRPVHEPKNNPLDKGLLAEKMVEQALPFIESQSGGTFDFTSSITVTVPSVLDSPVR